jgi:quercetin dioxygenase-like cupin family protein
VANYSIAQLDVLASVPCPCGLTRRAFVDETDKTASVHLVDISVDARVHFHKKMTEIYTVLQGEGFIELDGEKIPVKPMSVIKIKPGCRHRAIGNMRILNTAIPAFDAADEWFD